MLALECCEPVQKPLLIYSICLWLWPYFFALQGTEYFLINCFVSAWNVFLTDLELLYIWLRSWWGPDKKGIPGLCLVTHENLWRKGRQFNTTLALFAPLTRTNSSGPLVHDQICRWHPKMTLFSYYTRNKKIFDSAGIFRVFSSFFFSHFFVYVRFVYDLNQLLCRKRLKGEKWWCFCGCELQHKESSTEYRLLS